MRPLASTWDAQDRRSRAPTGDLGEPDADDGADDHVTREVDAGVHARIGDRSSASSQRRARPRLDSGHPLRKRERGSRVAGRRGREIGIRTWRALSTSRSGAGLRESGFIATLTISDVTPIATNPSTAAPPAPLAPREREHRARPEPRPQVVGGSREPRHRTVESRDLDPGNGRVGGGIDALRLGEPVR